MKQSNTNIEKLTRLLLSEDQSGLEFIRLVQMYLLNGTFERNTKNIAVSNIPEPKTGETGLKPVGTWHPVCRDGEIVFIRKEQSDSVFWESTCTQFSLKKEAGEKRVCVIGESVAAGMFFTPHISPSIALSNYLKLHSKVKWDIIDLTRNCMNAGALIETCHASLQLEPDFVVIIAGNNWFSDIFIEHDGPVTRRRNYANALDKGGMSGVIDAYKNNAERLAESVLQQINDMAKDSTAEFLFVIPALNYADWERRCPLHWLDNQKTSDWYELYRSAITAIEDLNYEAALELGREMIKIDSGTSSTSNRIVANCLIALKCFDEAYDYCVAECDNSLMYDQITSFPGVPSFLRRKYRESDYLCSHITFIDLESILAEHSGTKILGSSLFVDYCHLNPEGFHVAMAPIASHIISKSNEPKEGVDNSWQNLAEKTEQPKIDLFRLAVSYFCIALYGTHLNRPVTNELNLEKYISLFQKAVDCSESVLDIMELYVKGRSCQHGAGFSLSKSGQRFFELMNSPLDFPVAQEAPGVDALTIESICRTLDNNGRDGKKLLEEYQDGYIRLLDRGVDLTEPIYIEWINSVVRMAMDSEISTRRKLPFYKSWWPWSFFSLVSDTDHDLELELTCRLPLNENTNKDNKVIVSINSSPIELVSVNGRWSRHNIVISKKMLNKGLNRLSLEWPKLKQDENQEISNLKSRYFKGLKVDFFPVFGEVFSLIVRKKR